MMKTKIWFMFLLGVAFSQSFSQILHASQASEPVAPGFPDLGKVAFVLSWIVMVSAPIAAYFNFRSILKEKK